LGILDGNIDDLAESKTQPGSLIWSVGAFLLGLTVFFLFFFGVDYSFFPSDHPRSTGYLYLAISAPLIVVTTGRWPRYVAGLLGYAFLHGLFLLGSDHFPSTPAVIYSWAERLFMLFYCAAGALLVMTFENRRLRIFDRVALCAFVLSACLGIILPDPTLSSVQGTAAHEAVGAGVTAVGLGVLATPWAYDRMRRGAARRGQASLAKSTTAIREGG